MEQGIKKNENSAMLITLMEKFQYIRKRVYWTPHSHFLFSNSWERVHVMLLIWSSRQNVLFSKLPREILYEILQFSETPIEWNSLLISFQSRWVERALIHEGEEWVSTKSDLSPGKDLAFKFGKCWAKDPNTGHYRYLARLYFLIQKWK